MRLSNVYVPTLKESPSDIDSASYRLLLRAGMIRKLSLGTYSFLPMGYRVIKKIENIVREEMDRIDSQETLLPILLPASLWEQSGRWEKFGPEMFRVKDRHDKWYCMGPTHEEAFTDLVKNELNSYKQLPLSLYQIQNKYRDEIRPRFGLIRGREFIMKDAYTFDKDADALKESYMKMWKAYDEVFKRCGLDYVVVEGDSGAMGGSDSHEFIALSETGESKVFYCEACGYAATDEKTPVKYEVSPSSEAQVEAEEVHTPSVSTIADLAEFFSCEESAFAKAMAYKVNGEYIVVLIPGNRMLNPTKLINYLGIAEHELELALDHEISGEMGSVPGFIGPCGLSDGMRLIVDSRVTHMVNMVVGANKADYHMKGVNFRKDFSTEEVVEDLLMAEEGDTCPHCDKALAADYGDEVGNIFQLGDKYSKALDTTFLDENGKARHFMMGSYGIGVSRTLAAIVDQYSSENSMVWPESVSPYKVLVTVVNMKKDEQVALGEKIYEELKAKGIEVLIDDRPIRVGKKFADGDLIGIPYRITVGKMAGDNIVEFFDRIKDEKNDVEADKITELI